MRQLSRTKIIKECRLTRIALREIIKDFKNGMYESTTRSIFDEKMIMQTECRLKRCQGKLEYDLIKKTFYCNECFLYQKKKYLRDEYSIGSIAKIDKQNGIAVNYRTRDLAQVEQALRNVSRVAVDDLKAQEPNNEQKTEAYKLYSKLYDTLSQLRIEFTKASNHEQLYTLIKDNRIMTLEEINEHVKDKTRLNLCIVDQIMILLSVKNIRNIVVLNLNEPDKKLIHAEKKLKDLYCR